MSPIVALSGPMIEVVAGKAGGLLGDDAEADRMVVAPGDQRRAGRRAERGGVELGVAQPVRGERVERRRRDDAAEGAGDAVAGVVGHDQQHVRRALAAARPSAATRASSSRASRLIMPPKAGACGRQRLSVDRRGGARRAGRAGHLLLRRGRHGKRTGTDHQCGIEPYIHRYTSPIVPAACRGEPPHPAQVADTPQRSLLVGS